MVRIVLVLALGLFSSSSNARPANPPAATLRAALAGEWTGALGYRDYQSDRMYELPVETSIEGVADGVTQISRSRFDEGPGKKQAWITTVSIDDPQAGTVTSTSFRKGQPVEIETEVVELVKYTGPTAWTIAYRHKGRDNNQLADIRVTQTRNGSELLSIEDVSEPDANTWKFRNQTRLHRKNS